jgi:hypothetical protein
MLMIASIHLAQTRSQNTPAVQSTPDGCEMNSSSLNIVAKDELPRDGVVIAIARLGNGETSRLLNQRRLLGVKGGLIKSGLPEQRIVIAEGERVIGYGRVELYSAGKLQMTLLAFPNKVLCVDCCFDPPNALHQQRKKQR